MCEPWRAVAAARTSRLLGRLAGQDGAFGREGAHEDHCENAVVLTERFEEDSQGVEDLQRSAVQVHRGRGLLSGPISAAPRERMCTLGWSSQTSERTT